MKNIVLIAIVTIACIVTGCRGKITQEEANRDFLDAVSTRNLVAIQKAVDHGADLNAKNEYGVPMLVYSAAVGANEIVSLLIKNGAEIDVQDEKRISALHSAAYQNRVETVKLLLSFDANVNSVDSLGRTPLFVAIGVAGKAKINGENSDKKTVVQLLLQSGAKVNIKNGSDFTPLIVAAQLGRAEIVSELLEHGATVDASRERGGTALSFASDGGYIQCVKLLVAAGADVNFVDKKAHVSPLIIASFQGHSDVVEYLLAHGADKSIKDSNGRSAQDHAVKRGHRSIVSLLQ